MNLKKYNRLTEDSLFEMANISKAKTGLDYIIWVMYKTNKEKHGARIKIKIQNNFIPITISDNPELKSNIKIDAKALNKIKQFIIQNKDVLLKYWEAQGEIGIDEVIDKFKKV